MSIWLCAFAARMRSPSSTETTTLTGFVELLPPRTCTAFTTSGLRPARGSACAEETLLE